MILNCRMGIGAGVGPHFFLICGAALLVTLTGCKKDPPPVDVVLDWKTQDGFEQQGILYTPKQENPPGLILVHAYGGNRGDWELFAVRARAHGYMVLAYDMRGHGFSTKQNGKSARYNRFDRKDWRRAITDIGFAKKQLIDQGASTNNLFIVGASIGANMAVEYASKDDEIQAVILLSPGIEYKGIGIEKTIKANRRLPILLMTAEGDRYSAKSAEKMKAWSPSYTELRTYAGTSHGTDLVSRTERIIEDIFVWLKPIVEE